MAQVGFLFALFVLAVWYWEQHAAPRRAKRRKAREECARFGHRWGAPFVAIGTLMRNCERCGKQEHHHRETDSWH